MSELVKLGDVIRELMALFAQRREFEMRIRENRASEEDHAELRALNGALQIRDESKKRYGVING